MKYSRIANALAFICAAISVRAAPCFDILSLLSGFVPGIASGNLPGNTRGIIPSVITTLFGDSRTDSQSQYTNLPNIYGPGYPPGYVPGYAVNPYPNPIPGQAPRSGGRARPRARLAIPSQALLAVPHPAVRVTIPIHGNRPNVVHHHVVGHHVVDHQINNPRRIGHQNLARRLHP